MSANPRSQRLLGAYGGASSKTVQFTCPQGFIVLVKSALFWNQGPEPETIVFGTSFAPNSLNTLLKNDSIPAGSMESWEGWFVLNPTDYIFVILPDNTCMAAVYGAVLSGPPPLTPAGP